MKKIALLFDGVICTEQLGEELVPLISGKPVPGIKEALDEIKSRGDKIQIFSRRCSTNASKEALRNWLGENQIQYDTLHKGIPREADVVIGVRAVTFDGNTMALPERVDKFVPWCYVEPAVVSGHETLCSIAELNKTAAGDILIIDKPFWNCDFCFVVNGFYMAGDNLFAFGLTFKAGQPYEYTFFFVDKSLFKIYKGPSREKIYADYAAAKSRLAARRREVEPKPAPSEEEPHHVLPDVLNRTRVFTPTCDNCQLKANETCFGQKSICGDFRMIPYVSEEEKEAWPAYGDATAIMLQDHSHW